jgi:hypothetical protein
MVGVCVVVGDGVWVEVTVAVGEELTVMDGISAVISGLLSTFSRGG